MLTPVAPLASSDGSANVVGASPQTTVTPSTESLASDDLVIDRPGDEVPAPSAPSDMVPPEAEVSTMVTEQCANTEVTAVDVTMVQPADIIIAVDTSGSMGEETEFVQSYLNQFSQQIIDSGIDVRVILIANPQPAQGEEAEEQAAPMMGRGGGAQRFGVCLAPPLGSGNCPDDENLPIYAHVPQAVGSNDVLNIFISTFPQWQQHLRPEASKSLVIVSDDNATDEPLNSSQLFTDALQALSPELFASWTFNGIFCGMECPPNSEAIGTVFQDLIAQTSGVAGELCSQDFQPVFDRLAEQIITGAGSQIACEWSLPTPPPGQTFSVDLVEVNRTTEQGGTVMFTRVPSLADCGPGSWYFDDSLNPTRVLACPETCEAMQGEEGGSIDVAFSCELIAGCAASGATSVGAMAASSCAFPLPTPPAGVVLDVATVNVRYETPSGFGVVLGVVPSAEECANVAGGWYFDDPQSPTTIHLCPATCTAHQAGTVTNVRAIFGCDSKPAPRTVR
jgi:hypothetical protein